MSEFKGTPGPWKFHELSHDDGLHMGYIRPFEEDGLEIAHHGDMGRSGEENLANAHLLAGSWDLLHFAIDQRKKLHCVCRLNEIVAPLGAGIECTACRLDALLAKAFNTDGK